MFNRTSALGQIHKKTVDLLESENSKREYIKYRKEFEEAAGFKKLHDFPIHIDIEIDNFCNFACTFCPIGQKDNELNETNIAILSCYFPLYKLLDQIPSLTSFNSSNQSFKELIELQVTEPIKEIELSKNIKKLGSINDCISQKVKSQYEENPYPRWRYGSRQKSQKLSIKEAINLEIKPNYVNKNESDHQLKVLIAGCGTGNQILQTQRYKNAQITAVDLRLSSLSYDQRKINELGINNVELIQMDILEVSLLEEQFDVIECSGVLHHMNNPSKGLKAVSYTHLTLPTNREV